MSRRTKPRDGQPRVAVDSEVVRQIRQHARSCAKTEVCGVLIGDDAEEHVSIYACIAGLNAAQAGTHVTFTQDTWEHIYKTKDAKYPESRIVGWYHSHPGFGVFLSDHDTFIHKNFFSSPLQVAWVYDPHSDEEGCFGWAGERLERLSEVRIRDARGGEGAGETGKPEPVGMQDEEEQQQAVTEDDRREENGLWLRIAANVLIYILVLAVGFMASWMFFPRRSIYVFDPQTGYVYEPAADGKHLELVPGLRVAPDALPAAGQPGLEPGSDTHAAPGGSEQKRGETKPSAADSASGKEKNGPR